MHIKKSLSGQLYNFSYDGDKMKVSNKENIYNWNVSN
jgi:hypothetical protein